MSSSMSSLRALHYVLKIGNRSKNYHFFVNVLAMKVLRHEEFADGCKATCNGPYDGLWSKTMIGYGCEDTNFVLELTYNYGINGYKLGDDFNAITIESKRVFNKVMSSDYEFNAEDRRSVSLLSPDGYRFVVKDTTDGSDRIACVSLSCSSLDQTINYWQQLIGMNVLSATNKTVVLAIDDSQCRLEFIDIGCDVRHEKAFGRIAFSCPEDRLAAIEAKMKEEKQSILTPLVSLDTPGKATVQVVILADPSAHEICFVGDEAFRQLSQMDTKADEKINKAMTEDKSDEWFERKGRSKDSV